MNDKFFDNARMAHGNGWPQGLFGSNDHPFGAFSNQNISSEYGFQYSTANTFDSKNGFAMESRKFIDSEGNLFQDSSRSLGNAKWSRVEKMTANGERGMIERLYNLNEHEKELFEQEWSKRINTPFAARINPLMKSPKERIIPIQRSEQSGLGFNESQNQSVPDRWSLPPSVLHQQTFSPDHVQQQQMQQSPPPVLVQQDQGQGGESWTRWTLRMLRMV